MRETSWSLMRLALQNTDQFDVIALGCVHVKCGQICKSAHRQQPELPQPHMKLLARKSRTQLARHRWSLLAACLFIPFAVLPLTGVAGLALHSTCCAAIYGSCWPGSPFHLLCCHLWKWLACFSIAFAVLPLKGVALQTQLQFLWVLLPAAAHPAGPGCPSSGLVLH